MKFIFTLILTVSSFSNVFAQALDTAPAQPRALCAIMKDMGDNMKQALALLKSKNYQAILPFIEDIEQLSKEAHDAIPSNLKNPDGTVNDPAAYADFQKDITDLTGGLDDLIAALQAGNDAAVSAGFTNIKNIQTDGHQSHKLQGACKP